MTTANELKELLHNAMPIHDTDKLHTAIDAICAERDALQLSLAEQTAAYWKAHKQTQQLTANLTNACQMGLDIAKERDALQARCDAAEKDAVRFRFMTDHLDTGMYLVDAHTPCDYYDEELGIVTDLQVWRLCIDAAMGESK